MTAIVIRSEFVAKCIPLSRTLRLKSYSPPVFYSTDRSMHASNILPIRVLRHIASVSMKQVHHYSRSFSTDNGNLTWHVYLRYHEGLSFCVLLCRYQCQTCSTILQSRISCKVIMVGLTFYVHALLTLLQKMNNKSQKCKVNYIYWKNPKWAVRLRNKRVLFTNHTYKKPNLLQFGPWSLCHCYTIPSKSVA